MRSVAPHLLLLLSTGKDVTRGLQGSQWLKSIHFDLTERLQALTMMQLVLICLHVPLHKDFSFYGRLEIKLLQYITTLVVYDSGTLMRGGLKTLLLLQQLGPIFFDDYVERGMSFTDTMVLLQGELAPCASCLFDAAVCEQFMIIIKLLVQSEHHLLGDGLQTLNM